MWKRYRVEAPQSRTYRTLASSWGLRIVTMTIGGATKAIVAPVKPGRLRSIQAMRGVAALLVLVTHSVDRTLRSDQDSEPFLLNQFGHWGAFGAIGVDLFFIISGFVMAFSVLGRDGPKAASTFMVLRFIRISPPYLVASLAMVVWTYVGTRSFGDWRSIFNAVFLVPWADTAGFSPPPLAIGWTLSFEFSFYLFIAVMVLLRMGRRIELLAPAIAVVVGIGQLFPSSVFLLQWFSNPIFLEFSLGIAAYWLWSRGLLDRFRWAWVTAAGVGLGTLAVQIVIGFGDIAEYKHVLDGSVSMQRVLWWGVPVAVIFLGILAARWEPRGWLGMAAEKLGEISYSLYLCHLIALLVFTSLVLKRLPFEVPSDLAFALCVLLGLGSGSLFYRFVERPLTLYLRGKVT